MTEREELQFLRRENARLEYEFAQGEMQVMGLMWVRSTTHPERIDAFTYEEWRRISHLRKIPWS